VCENLKHVWRLQVTGDELGGLRWLTFFTPEAQEQCENCPVTQDTTISRLHQRRSNLGSTEPSSSLIGDLNRLQVTLRCTNLNSDQLTVVQLNGGGYSVDDADWLTTVTSREMFTC